MSRILLVEDDPQAVESMRKILEWEGHAVCAASDGREALERVRASNSGPASERFDVIISDVRMPRLSGLEFLRALNESGSDVPFLLMTAYGRVEEAVWAMKMGAVDFLSKPFDRQALLKGLGAALKRARRGQGADKERPTELFGQSKPMLELKQRIAATAQTSATVLIRGESGVGKERVARLLHERSERAARAFVAVNCAAFPEHLIESELFGHERGAFTGAQGARIGLIESADGGTLFLDEIGDMPLALQAKLLRVLQEGEVRRVGANQSRKVDVRLVSATHRDLADSVRAGTFRQDLLFRLEVVTLEVPPLRERREDIPGLIDDFIHDANSRHGKAVEGVSSAALSVLLKHAWPGNVRELSNVIERAVVFSQGERLEIADLPEPMVELVHRKRASEVEVSDGESITIKIGTPLREIEDLLIQKALELTGGDKARAAEILGINSRTVYRWLEKR